VITLLVRDLWDPIWPNLAASAVWAPPAMWWHQSRLRRHVSAEVQQIRDDLANSSSEDEERVRD
jgi:hypothetical protein